MTRPDGLFRVSDRRHPLSAERYAARAPLLKDPRLAGRVAGKDALARAGANGRVYETSAGTRVVLEVPRIGIGDGVKLWVGDGAGWAEIGLPPGESSAQLCFHADGRQVGVGLATSCWRVDLFRREIHCVASGLRGTGALSVGWLGDALVVAETERLLVTGPADEVMEIGHPLAKLHALRPDLLAASSVWSGAGVLLLGLDGAQVVERARWPDELWSDAWSEAGCLYVNRHLAGLAVAVQGSTFQPSEFECAELRI